jgi:ankyrin repeat protein
VDLDAKYIVGKTALHRALELENYEIAELLIKSGAELNTVDDNGITPLQMAIMNVRDDRKYVKMLLDYGADPTAADASGQSVLDWVKEVEFTEMEEFLESYSEE